MEKKNSYAVHKRTCVCVCVRERERGREKERKKENKQKRRENRLNASERRNSDEV